MSLQPQVTAVIIFRDAARFLDEAIASVFAQTYAGWELLLVDDGSADGSSELARGWAKRHPDRVRYLTHPEQANRGMSASRNLGIAQARGEYLAFLDADDVWLPMTLAEQVRLLEAWPDAALVYGPLEWWYGWTGDVENQHHDVVERLGVPIDTRVEPPALVPLLLRNKAAVPSGFLVRRTVVEAVGRFEEQFRSEYEDQVFCAKVLLKYPVVASERCWYRYRQHADSCVSTSARQGRSRATRLAFLHWLAKYVWSQRVWRLDLIWALTIELWRWTYPTSYRLCQRIHRRSRRVLSPAGAAKPMEIPG
jgi:glycosyltransferase involved in cell wall biosynthesis